MSGGSDPFYAGGICGPGDGKDDDDGDMNDDGDGLTDPSFLAPDPEQQFQAQHPQMQNRHSMSGTYDSEVTHYLSHPIQSSVWGVERTDTTGVVQVSKQFFIQQIQQSQPGQYATRDKCRVFAVPSNQRSIEQPQPQPQTQGGFAQMIPDLRGGRVSGVDGFFEESKQEEEDEDEDEGEEEEEEKTDFDMIVNWTEEEIQMVEKLYHLNGHAWRVISDTILQTMRILKEPHMIFALWKQTKGFTLPIAYSGTRFCLKHVCRECYEDETSGKMHQCVECHSWYHQDCCSTPRREQWRCSNCASIEEKKQYCQSENIVESTKRLLSSSAEDAYVLLCYHKDCCPWTNANQFIVHGDKNGSHYGVYLGKTQNLKRHMETRHGCFESFDVLLRKGLIRRVPITRVTSIKSGLLLKPTPPSLSEDTVFDESTQEFAGDPDESCCSQSSSFSSTNSSMDGSDLSSLSTPSISTPISTSSSFPSTPIQEQFPVCDGRAPPTTWFIPYASTLVNFHPSSDMSVAACAIRETLTKFHWGSRCTSCMARETPIFSHGSLEVKYTPILPYSFFASTILSQIPLSGRRDLLLENIVRSVENECDPFFNHLRDIIHWQLLYCIGGGGLVPFGKESPRFWVVSMAAKMIDVDLTIIPGREFTCPIDGYKEVRPGDIVYFWGDVFFPQSMIVKKANARKKIAKDENGEPISDTSQMEATRKIDYCITASEKKIAGMVGVGRVVLGPRYVHEYGVVRNSEMISENVGELENRITVRVDNRFPLPVEPAEFIKKPQLSQKDLCAEPGIRLIAFRDNMACVVQGLINKNLSKVDSQKCLPYGEDQRLAGELVARVLQRDPNATTIQMDNYGLGNREFNLAMQWLLRAKCVVYGDNCFNVASVFKSVREVSAWLQKEHSLIHQEALRSGCCIYCHSNVTPESLVSCSGGCGQVAHLYCLPLLGPRLDHFAKQLWRCPDCADDGTANLCGWCGKREKTEEIITCDCCCEWYHTKCARVSVPPRAEERLWLCQKCVISPIQAARCEIHLLCSELAYQLTHILHTLSVQHFFAPFTDLPQEELQMRMFDAAKNKLTAVSSAIVSFHTALNNNRIEEESTSQIEYCKRDITAHFSRKSKSEQAGMKRAHSMTSSVGKGGKYSKPDPSSQP